MKNPFAYRNYVTGDSFCNRSKELAELLRYVKSVSLKTGSLVTKALSVLMKKEIIVKNGNYMIQDIVFKKWLQKTLFL